MNDQCGSACERARLGLVYFDGAEEGGALPELARRARLLARDVLELAESLEAERSARVAVQASRDRLLAIVAGEAYRACERAS